MEKNIVLATSRQLHEADLAEQQRRGASQIWAALEAHIDSRPEGFYGAFVGRKVLIPK